MSARLESLLDNERRRDCEDNDSWYGVPDVATWSNITPLRREPRAYVSPAEQQRRDRVAVGRICRCGRCLCCAELAKERAS